MSETPDEVHLLPTEMCPCGCSLLETAPIKVIRHQIFDVVHSPLHITEYRSEVKRCPHCSSRVSSDFPKEAANTINFGKNIKTLAVYLNSELLIPYAKVVRMIRDFYGLTLSPATIEGFLTTASNSLDAYEHEVRMKLLESPVLHADETGFYVEGKREWLHVLSTDKLTFYGVHKSRGKEAIESMKIIPLYKGILVHDFWNSYMGYLCYHAFCNAHIIRELQGIYDGFKQEWAKEMRSLLEKTYKYVFNRKIHRKWEIQELLDEYDRILLQGELANPPPPKEEGKKGKPKNTKA
ncbi:MAG: IS66 family transposase, partial [Euryarchaeota archaeon]|nr:IS66 family transposase [Euryarchaeota archaeon]